MTNFAENILWTTSLDIETPVANSRLSLRDSLANSRSIIWDCSIMRLQRFGLPLHPSHITMGYRSGHMPIPPAVRARPWHL